MKRYPYTIDNGQGERMTFLRVVRDAEGERVEGGMRAQPGAGPPMHIHKFQEEAVETVPIRVHHARNTGTRAAIRVSPSSS